MSRIDVVPAEKGRFKVLVNFMQRGVAYSNPALANKEATAIHIKMPHATLSLIGGDIAKGSAQKN
jgi:hypothetical protein